MSHQTMKNKIIKILDSILESDYPLINSYEESESNENVFWVESSHFDNLSSYLSKELGGSWYPGASGVVFRHSKEVFYFLDIEKEEEIYQAKKIYEMVTGVYVSPWGIGACARALFEWAGVDKLQHSCSGDSFIKINANNENSGWHYYHVEPGNYENLKLFDLYAAYPSMLLRMPSLLVADCGGPVFRSMPSIIEERTRKALLAMMEHKDLRTTLCGALAAKRAIVVHNGRATVRPIAPSPLRAASLLATATVFSLCGEVKRYLQGKGISLRYTNTDCFGIDADNIEFLDDLNIKYKEEANGNSDIIGRCVYRIGGYYTDFYDEYIRSGKNKYRPESIQTNHDSSILRWIK